MESTSAPKTRNTDVMHKRLSGVILGAFYAVHSELGYGFLEAVYANALAVLLRGAGCRVQREIPFDILFRNELVGHYRANLVVDSLIVVEVKAAETIVPEHVSLLIHYLKATGLPGGLLLNFGPTPTFRRVVWSRRHTREGGYFGRISP